MFNKPPRRRKLYAVLDVAEIVGVFPTKKLAKEFAGTDKKVVELFWTGGYYNTEAEQMQDITAVPIYDF